MFKQQRVTFISLWEYIMGNSAAGLGSLLLNELKKSWISGQMSVDQPTCSPRFSK